MSCLLAFLVIVGSVQIAKLLSNIIWQIVKELIPLGRSLEKYGQNSGKWAVVTGGSDGIGLGFCEVLAQLGWNVCIISRNQQKLQRTIKMIGEKLEKQNKKIPLFKYIVSNFKCSNQKQFFESIRSQLDEVKIGILVNNVGTADPKCYDQHSAEQVIDMININCASMAALTAVLLNKMKQQKSAIINLSSFVGQNPAPYSTLYAATKAFNASFSQSLSLQKQLKNVDILSVKPMFVVSPLSKQKKSFTVPDRRQCAHACLKQLRWEYETYGYFVHRILGIVANLPPKWIRRQITVVQADRLLAQYKKL